MINIRANILINLHYLLVTFTPPQNCVSHLGWMKSNIPRHSKFMINMKSGHYTV